MKQLESLNIKLFADGADKTSILTLSQQPHIKGFTTNPTLMRKAGIVDYRQFCQDILSEVKNKPISFEVFSDDFLEMERQAMEIASWGEQVYVKIPITNTQQESCIPLIKKLSSQQVKLNITAVMTLSQIEQVVAAIHPAVPSYLSIFAGRIADTGRDPIPIMSTTLELLKTTPATQLIWASPRELLNIFQADAIGCHIITLTNDILQKLSLVGYDLAAYSLDTVRMFYDDALTVGFQLEQ